jgi:GNAT superfamily N-acetyltransferase
MTDAFSIGLSPLDEQRFGVRTARTLLTAPGDLKAVSDFCQLNQVRFVIARCQTHNLGLVQQLEQSGFFLADTLVYYKCNLLKTPIPDDTTRVPIRTVQPDDEDSVSAVAERAFRGYFGHYHADSRLDPRKCDEVYVDWAVRSCLSRDIANEVLIADSAGTVVGFATLRLNDADEGEGVLFGVAPEAQGQGVYRSFMIQGMKWCYDRGANQMLVSTQITNIAVQKAWVRLGFEPDYSYYTLHKWLE